MMDRKTIKRRARAHLKRHYVLLVMLCAISIFFGTEFTDVVSNAQTWYDTLTRQQTRLDAPGSKEPRDAMAKVIDDLIDDNIEAGNEEAAARMRAMQAESEADPMLGRSRGIFAAAVNSLSSGRLYAQIGMALHSVVHSQQWTAALMILGAAALYTLVWVFLKNVYGVILRRAFLETRTYEAFPLGHLFHLRRVRRWGRASLTMLLMSVYETLWWLTLVGGAIKHYAYFLVPFIAAENPDIKPREAIALSRLMMDGHKWECFKLDLSYMGWAILGYVTFGVAQALWTAPYRVAAYAEYYAALRTEALEKGILGAERLNDECLYAHASSDALCQRYAEIARHEAVIEEDIVELSPRRRFFARNFGIWTGSLVEKKIYSRQEGLRQQTRVGRLELNGEAYPERLNPLWRKDVNALEGRTSYLTPCTVWSLIVVFFAFCMVGWIWEVSLHLITDGSFANRGTLHGPWLPIYGSGVTMIAVLLYRLRRRPMLEAAAVMALCGAVEYLSSWYLEVTKGMRWWDYTGYFLNLNGRICGEGLAVFCVGGMAAVYLLVPLIDALVTRAKPKALVAVCLALVALFVGDMVYSHFVPNVGEGITDYKPPVIEARAKGDDTEGMQEFPPDLTLCAETSIIVIYSNM